MKIFDFFKKVYTWIKANGATLLGVVEAVLKAIKEIITAVVNLLSIFIPADTAQALVMNLRELINKIYEVVSEIKEKITDQLEG